MSERTVIEVGGTDRFSFLQGLVTNDVEKARAGLVYAALLTPQGKYLADFFMLAEGEVILLDVAAPLAAGLAQRLSMYKLRADVTVTASARDVARGSGPVPPGAHPDPRLPDLAWRAYDGRESDDTDWQALRVAHCLPESGVELTPDSYILESGFERLNGVDFRKGCYVGQEVTARMKHKTELKKGLVRVAVSGVAPVGTPITADGKPAGTLYSQANGAGIAYLRLDRAKDPMQAGDAQVTL